MEAVGTSTAGGRGSRHLRAVDGRRRGTTNPDAVGVGRRRSGGHTTHAAASGHKHGDLGDVHGIGGGGLAGAGLGDGDGDDARLAGVLAGRVGAHVQLLGGLHGPTGVAGRGGDLVAGSAAQGGGKVVHVWKVLNSRTSRNRLISPTDTGLVAGIFGRLCQLRDRIFVGAQALRVVQVGAIVEFGHVDALESSSRAVVVLTSSLRGDGTGHEKSGNERAHLGRMGIRIW